MAEDITDFSGGLPVKVYPVETSNDTQLEADWKNMETRTPADNWTDYYNAEKRVTTVDGRMASMDQFNKAQEMANEDWVVQGINEVMASGVFDAEFGETKKAGKIDPKKFAEELGRYAKVESSGGAAWNKVSEGGARGALQVVPRTAKDMVGKQIRGLFLNQLKQFKAVPEKTTLADLNTMDLSFLSKNKKAGILYGAAALMAKIQTHPERYKYLEK